MEFSTTSLAARRRRRHRRKGEGRGGETRASFFARSCFSAREVAFSSDGQKLFRSSLKHKNKKSIFKKSIFKIDLFEQKALFDPKMNWFLPKTDTTRTFFGERMT